MFFNKMHNAKDFSHKAYKFYFLTLNKYFVAYKRFFLVFFIMIIYPQWFIYNLIIIVFQLNPHIG